MLKEEDRERVSLNLIVTDKNIFQHIAIMIFEYHHQRLNDSLAHLQYVNIHKTVCLCVCVCYRVIHRECDETCSFPMNFTNICTVRNLL